MEQIDWGSDIPEQTMSINGIVLNWFYEWVAKGKSYADLRQKLQKNEATVYARMSNATELSFNRHQSAHVIGIERWSAHRMRVLLGDSLVIDEYDGYAPSDQLSMVELAEEFRQTREATLALLQEL